jgi:hypothetical protein
MRSPEKIVLSASRRTDIPAFYMPWFMDRIEVGYFEAVNPYTRRVNIIQATPDNVHTIAFWSKNFGPFIDHGCGGRLLDAGYHLFFNFTINSDNNLLEPNLPPLNERLVQLEYLSATFGNRSINWRFDPICHYRFGQGTIRDNLQDFAKIGHRAAAAGVERCITSFMDNYRKIQRRLSRHAGLTFLDPPLIRKLDILMDLEKRLNKLKMRLATCCEKDVIAALPPESSIAPSSCIPNRLLKTLYGGDLSLRKDSGQRVKAGCGCQVSVDIGSYRDQPCYHNCLFCYANPVSGSNGNQNENRNRYLRK